MARERLAVAQVCDVRKSRDAIPKEDQPAEGPRLVVYRLHPLLGQDRAFTNPARALGYAQMSLLCCGFRSPTKRERAGVSRQKTAQRGDRAWAELNHVKVSQKVYALVSQRRERQNAPRSE